MNCPDELNSLNYLITLFEDQEEAIKLLLDSPYVIPLYNSGKFDDETGFQYYNLVKKIHEEITNPHNLSTSILIKHLNFSKLNFLEYFLFPGETRKERDQRIGYEYLSKLRFVDWYKKIKETYPNDDYSCTRFQIDFEYYKEYLHTNYPDIDFESSEDDDDDLIDISTIRNTNPNRTYNETGVPFSDDAGSEWWESRY